MFMPGCSLSRAISPTTSPLSTVELFQSGSRSVADTTYFSIALIRSLNGSPDRLDHTGANAS